MAKYLSPTHAERIKRALGNSGMHPDALLELSQAVDAVTQPIVSRTFTPPFPPPFTEFRDDEPTVDIPAESMSEILARGRTRTVDL